MESMVLVMVFTFNWPRDIKIGSCIRKFISFGAGPKNCIGMRFAIMEAKMALINMMQQYSVVKCNKTQVPLKCTQDGVHGPADGVYVQLAKRH